MYIDVSNTFDLKELVVRRTVDGVKWVMHLDNGAFVILDDRELDELKYAVDSAVFERDMGFEFGAHAADGSLNDLLHGADSGGKK